MAKTSKCLSRMNEIIRLRKIKKKYLALVEKKNIKKEGVLRNFLKKNSKKNKSFVVDEISKNAKEAILEYKIIKTLKNYLLLDILLVTGRHHQIRSQLANIGCVIKGDVKYGAKRANKDKSICLHAKNIEFIHPITKAKISLDANPPKSNIWSN